MRPLVMLSLRTGARSGRRGGHPACPSTVRRELEPGLSRNTPFAVSESGIFAKVVPYKPGPARSEEVLAADGVDALHHPFNDRQRSGLAASPIERVRKWPASTRRRAAGRAVAPIEVIGRTGPPPAQEVMWNDLHRLR